MTVTRPISRRESIARVAATTTVTAPLLGLSNAYAARLERTPSQSEGPYYPTTKPTPASNDLLHADGKARAEGRPLELSGRVVDTNGRALAGAQVEIWQCDDRGIYRHPRAPRQGDEDRHFRGYGASITDSAGAYRFLTIVPVAYTGRPPHIHAKVKAPGIAVLTTQLYLADHPKNDRDGLLARLFGGNRERLKIAPRAATVAGGLSGASAQFEFVV